MRGIQINNYFNNHITLNGKKVNHQPQPAIQSIRPKLNSNPNDDPNSATLETRSPPTKSAQLPPKKRTNTLLQLKRQVTNKRSLSTERHRNATSAKKREDLGSEEEQQEEDHNINNSHRKLKPSSSRGGLGKRSKSTIIRSGNHIEPQKGLSRKESKKENKKAPSNPTIQSIKPKTRRKKSSKIVEPTSNYKQIAKQVTKQIKQSVKSHTSKKDLLPGASREVVASWEVPIRDVKKQKLTLKLGKSQPRGDKKSARTHVGKQAAKPVINKSKGSKPVSAREKKSKKSRFIEELRQKYVNQTILEGQGSNRLRISDADDGMDKDFLVVMSSLQKVLNSVGSKQKLKKQLELINEKLRQFKLESEGDHSEQEHQEDEDVNHVEDVEDEYANKKNILLTPVGSIEQRREQAFEQTPGGQQQEQQNSSESSQEFEMKYRMEEHIEKDEGKQEVQLNDSSNLLVGKRNPLLGKRSHDFVFAQAEELDLELGSRRKQIELLKKFKNQSSKMMEKVGMNQFIPQLQPVGQSAEEVKHIQVQQAKQLNNSKQPKQLILLDVKSISVTSLSGHLMQDKYPIIRPKSPRFSQSPRFDEVQLLDMISLKEQFVSSRHDKMSELVHKMFQKQLVSPKSYDFQLKSLDKKYQQQNKALQSLKKQAEQMSSMLSQIKKDKQQIRNIDQLIRNQQWEQAQKLVHTAEMIAAMAHNAEMAQIAQVTRIVEKERAEAIASQPSHIRSAEKKMQKNAVGLGWQREQGWQRVRIKAAEVQNNQFVDIGVTTNRHHRPLQPRIDIDEECGGTEESVDLGQAHKGNDSEEEYIYYNEDNDNDGVEDGGLIRLVQVAVDGKDEAQQTDEKIASKNVANAGVFHIEEQSRDKSLEASIIDKNQSNASVGSSSQPERKGFTTNLYFIKQYCIALCEFVRDNMIFKAQFKKNVSKPLQYNLLTLFTQLRADELTPFFFSKREIKVAISELIWNEFNGQYQSLRCNGNRGKSGERYILQKEQQLIFVRMIYDVLNQSLDFQRPGGQFGRAFPWRQDAKHLKNLKQLGNSENENIQAYDLMFGVAIARIIQWGSCLCGFLPDTVQLENTEIDESYVNHIRETRMAFLLEKMMAQEEAVMTNFQMQEVDIMTRVSKAMLDELMKEFVGEFQTLAQSEF